MEGKINKQLKKVLKKIVKEAHEPLAVADAKLGGHKGKAESQLYP